MIKLLKNWKKEILSNFICPNRIFIIFGHFENVLPFCNGKTSKLNFKNIKKYENHWKHKYIYLYV